MSEMSLEQQIRCMREMRCYLEDFCSVMHGTMENLQNDIKFLVSQGLSKENGETYQKEYYSQANNDVERVVNNIRQQHFDYIDRVINHLERASNER